MKRGFTLVEILVAIAVMSVVIGILVPVMSQARLAGHRTVTRSNLHQASLVLLMYADEYDGKFPIASAVEATMGSAPVCDALDDWHRPCTRVLSAPLVGSYAFGGLILDPADSGDWRSKVQEMPRAPLVVSIFLGNNKIKRFAGDAPQFAACGPIGECDMPMRVLVAYSDGSVKFVDLVQVEGANRFLFSWSSMYDYVLRKTRVEQ
ncbi:MAG: type II secretion system protein [Fimbriimonadaceae bacterium]